MSHRLLQRDKRERDTVRDFIIWNIMHIKFKKPISHLILLCFCSVASLSHSQDEAPQDWSSEEVRDPSGVILSISVESSGGTPETLNYSMKNGNSSPVDVWLPKNKSDIKTFITIFHGEKLLRSFTISIAANGIPELVSTIISPDEVLSWSFNILDLVDDPIYFQEIENFERFQIGLRLPRFVAENKNDSPASPEDRRGVSLRWRWRAPSASSQ